MKRIVMAAAAAAFISSAAHADALAPEEAAFVAAAVGTMAGETFCNYEGDYKALAKAADKFGVSFKKYAGAVVAAVGALQDLPYDRANLIPEVTRGVRAHLQEFDPQIKRNRDRFCATLLEQLSSFLKKK